MNLLWISDRHLKALSIGIWILTDHSPRFDVAYDL